MFELHRQLVHLSGLLFVILANFVSRETGIAYFFIIALFFLAYSLYVRREEKRLRGFLNRFDSAFRGLASRFERDKNIEKPFMGAFYFYLGCGLSFLIFPLNIASAACAMLAVGDSFATVIGKKFGKHRVYEGKTFEGSIGCFFGSVLGFLIISLVSQNPLPIFLGVFGAFVATFAELTPRVDDNLAMPLISGFAMFVL